MLEVSVGEELTKLMLSEVDNETKHPIFFFRVLREIESIRHDASLLKEQMTLVKEDIRAVIILFSQSFW